MSIQDPFFLNIEISASCNKVCQKPLFQNRLKKKKNRADLFSAFA